MKPNFKDIDIFAGFHPQNGKEWQKDNITADWNTPEHINVQPVYTQEDLEGMEHLDFAAGIPRIPRPVQHDVPVPSVDYPPIRRFLHCRGK